MPTCPPHPLAQSGPGGLGWRLLAGARSPGGLGVSTAGRDCARHPSLGRAHLVSLGARLPEGQTGLVGRGEDKDPAEQSWRPHGHLCHMGCSAELAGPQRDHCMPGPASPRQKGGPLLWGVGRPGSLEAPLRASGEERVLPAELSIPGTTPGPLKGSKGRGHRAGQPHPQLAPSMGGGGGERRATVATHFAFAKMFNKL